MDFYPLFFAWSKQMQLTSGTRSDGSLITFANADGYNNRHEPTWWKRPPRCSSLHIQVTTSRGDMPEALPGPRCGVSGNLASSCRGCECAWWVLLLAEEGLRKTRWGPQDLVWIGFIDEAPFIKDPPQHYACHRSSEILLFWGSPCSSFRSLRIWCL